MVEQLTSTLPVRSVKLADGSALDQLRNEMSRPDGSNAAATISVMCRSLDQLRVCCSLDIDRLIADFADIPRVPGSGRIVPSERKDSSACDSANSEAGEMGLFRAMLKHQPDAVLVRNLSGLAFFRDNGIPVAGDYSLNVTNELTASFLMSQHLQWMTPSYDMNRDQLMDLVRVVPADWLEVVVHQHMPMFHMEHCVFCAMLSPGTTRPNCGRPCDFHTVELRDRTGTDHPLVADVGCRNTLFNAVRTKFGQRSLRN